MSEDSRFVIIKSDVSYAYGVLDMQTRQVACRFNTLDSARRVQQKCLDGQTQCLWWSSLSKFVQLHGDWSVVPDQSDKPDQLLPPGSFKPPTRADFKDDSVPSGDALPPTQTPVYAVNVDLPELAADLTVNRDKYITYTHSEWPSRYALLANRNNQSRGVIDLTLNRVVLFDDIDALHCAHNLLIHCLTEQEVNPLLWEEPYFEAFYQESGWFIVPDSTRYRLLECHASKGWCVYDTQTQCIAHSGLHLTDKGILRICLEGRGDCFTWTPAKHCLLGHGNWGSVPQTDSTDTSDKRRDTYIDCLQQGASLGAVCDHVPSGNVTQSTKGVLDDALSQLRYVIVQANNDRRSYAVWDQDKCRMAPVSTLTRVVEMWQQCVDGTDIEFCWITVNQFKKSYGDWSVITQLGEVIDTSDVVDTSDPTTTVSCVGTGCESPTGVFTDVQAKPATGHRQIPMTMEAAQQQFSIATVLDGAFKGRWVLVYAEFLDGMCLIELDRDSQRTMGTDGRFRVIQRDILHIWGKCAATSSQKDLNDE